MTHDSYAVQTSRAVARHPRAVVSIFTTLCIWTIVTLISPGVQPGTLCMSCTETLYVMLSSTVGGCAQCGCRLPGPVAGCTEVVYASRVSASMCFGGRRCAGKRFLELRRQPLPTQKRAGSSTPCPRGRGARKRSAVMNGIGVGKDQGLLNLDCQGRSCCGGSHRQ